MYSIHTGIRHCSLEDSTASYDTGIEAAGLVLNKKMKRREESWAVDLIQRISVSKAEIYGVLFCFLPCDFYFFFVFADY